MIVLTFATAQAESSERMMAAVLDYLSARLNWPMTAVNDLLWQERLRRIGDGRIDIGWICGSYYTRLANEPQPVVELLAAPVMAEARYQGRPVYYSDVIVHKDSPYRQFEDLRGATFAANEPGSMSGNWTMRYHLAQIRAIDGFFGRVVYSGAHMNSVRMVLNGEADTAAIDSMVMEAEVKASLEMAADIRVITVLGPTPIPPWVVRRGLPKTIRQQLRQALVTLFDDEAGRKVLEGCGISGFSAVGDGYYEPVREMIAKAAEVFW